MGYLDFSISPICLKFKQSGKTATVLLFLTDKVCGGLNNKMNLQHMKWRKWYEQTQNKANAHSYGAVRHHGYGYAACPGAG